MASGAVVGRLAKLALEAFGKDAGKALEKDVAKDLERDVARDLDKDVAKDVETDVTKDLERDTARDAAKDPAKVGTPEGNRTCAGDPVDMASGEVILGHTDVSLPGTLPLLLRRTHISSYRIGLSFGPSWASTLDQRVEVDERGVCYVAADGMVLVYPHPDAGPVLPVTGPRWELARGTAGYMVTEPETGWVRHFALDPLAGGRTVVPLSALSNRLGHRMDIDRAPDGRPELVRHSGGYRIAVESAESAAGPRVGALRLLDPDRTGDPGASLELVRFGYDPHGRLVEVLNSAGRPLRLQYDAAGRLTRWIDRTGQWYSYRYDSAGRCTATDGSGGRLAATISYDDQARRVSYDAGAGTVRTYERNELGQIVRETDPLGGTVNRTFDGQDRLLSSTDQLGRTTWCEYDPAGNLTRVTGPDGATRAATFNEFRLPTAITTATGALTGYEYDGRGNLAAVVDPTGARTGYGYDERGNLAWATNQVGETRMVGCDAAGLPVSVTEPTGANTRYHRDGFGRVVAITDPNGAVTRYGYTVEGKLSWRTDPNGAMHRCGYDAEGNLTSYTDALGQVTTMEVGPFGLTTARTGPDGARWQFEYDAQLRLTAVVNPAGAAWRYRYDPAGRLVAETDVNGRDTGYEYDAAGRLTARVGAAGRTGYQRDEAGNVVQRETAGVLTRYAYDPAGRLVWAANAAAELRLERDPTGRVVAESTAGRTLASAYDPVGRRVWRRTHSGADSGWQYAAGQQVRALSTGGQSVGFEHDAAGHQTRRWLVGGPELVQSFDPAHRLTGQYVRVPGGPAASLRAYRYDPNGSLAGVVDHLDGQRQLVLDPAGRVGGVHGPGWEERYAYGPDGTCGYGQWPTAPTAPAAAAPVGAAPAAGAPAAAAEPDDDLSAAAGPREYAGSQVRRAGRTYYQHDAAGRLVLRTRRTLSGRTRAWRYAWDSEDRLTAVSTPDGEFWQYGYDPLGRRISKRRLAGGVVLEQVDFCWDGTVLAEQTRTVYAANGPQAATTTWEYAPGGRTPLTQLDRYWPAAGAAPAQRLHLVVSDPVGSPTELIGAGGTLTWYRAGNLWGGPRRAVRQAGADCPLRFPGQYEDAETGLHYNLMRYYDPATARYCSPDPLGCPGGPDPHAYVPNPTVWCDPLGLSCEDALNALGVDDAGKQAFHNGDVVQFGFPTEHGSVDGFLQHSDGKLTAQIFSIHDTEGGGAAGFMKFMRESLNLGRSLGLSEVELQGGALINKELEAGLLKRGFLPKQIPIPEALGGGGMLDVLYKVFPVLPVR